MLNVLEPIKSSRQRAERQVVYFLLTRYLDTHIVLSTLISPEAFSSTILRKVFAAVLRLYQAGESTDITAVQRELEKSGNGNVPLSEILKECGEACESGNTPETVEMAVSILTEHWNVDQARQAFISVNGWDGFVSLARKIFDLDAGTNDGTSRTPTEIVGGIIERQEAIYAGTAEAGYSWGLPRIDDVCRMTPGLYILSGLKKAAKTHFLLHILDHNLTLDDAVPCCLFSLEMSETNIFKRLLARHTGVDSHRIHSRFLSYEDFNKLKSEYEKLKSEVYPLHIDDGANLTVTDIASRARRWKYQNQVPDGVGIIGVDFLQLIKLERRNGDSEASGIKHCAYSLARLAKDLDVVVIACAQFRNAAEEQVPHIGFLEGSGAIAQSAEAILMVDLLRRRDRGHKSEDELEDVNIIVGEQRNGESGIRVKCTVDLKTSRFFEKETKYKQKSLAV